ncbi:MAG: proton-conducting transporter transmembrane domain-containing protein [Candidatus Dormibacteria bacterium]
MAEAVLVLLVVAAAGWLLSPLLVVSLPRGAARLALVAGAGVIGSLACGAAGILALLEQPGVITATLGSWQGLGGADLRVDALSGFFLALTGTTSALLFIARAASLPHLRGRLHIAALAGLLVSLETLLVADNAFFFMCGWEGLAITFYLVVAAGHRQHAGATQAARWTLGMTKLGGAAVLAAFLAVSAGAGSFSFSAFRAGAPDLAAGLADAAFVCAFFGFGVKMALIPLQSWLPRAYPMAPTGSPAFLAAVALNAALYGLIRFLSILSGGPLWWGLTILLTGAVTAVLGILYAATQTDLKGLVAYSSVENVGIILCGVGAYAVGRSVGLPLLAGVGMLAALFQISVHTVSKAALFVCADAVERHSGTTDMERLGGLTRTLPGVAGVFFAAAATIIGLPPFGGFASEWLTLETLMQGFRIHVLAAQVSFAVAGALLALTAAVAGLAFVKATFATFLGFGRSSRPRVRVGLANPLAGAVLALLGVGLGIGAPWVVVGLGRAAAAASAGDVSAQVSTGGLLIEPAFAHFSSIAPTEMALVLPGFALGLVFLLAAVRNRAAPVVRTPVWASGAVTAQSRTQYTPTGWSNPLRVVFDTVLRTRRRRTVAGPALAPQSISYWSSVPSVVDERVLQPIIDLVTRSARVAQRLQSGSLAQYLLYILLVLAVVLLLVPVGR